ALDQHRHHLPRLLRGAALAQHPRPGGGGGGRDLPRGGPARPHARPPPDGGRLPVRRRPRDGDEAGAVLRGRRGARRPRADRAPLAAGPRLHPRRRRAVRRGGRGDVPLRALQGHRPARGRPPRHRGAVVRRLRAERRRARRAGDGRCDRAAAARRDERPRQRAHRLVLRPRAQRAELHAPARVPRARRAPRAPLGRPREDRQLARGGGGAADPAPRRRL
ncbi:MAG: tRNA (guanine(37)-N(1))-methyltransferase, partial [uncultured Gemmatimonadaceae bacterium]